MSFFLANFVKKSKSKFSGFLCDAAILKCLKICRSLKSNLHHDLPTTKIRKKLECYLPIGSRFRIAFAHFWGMYVCRVFKFSEVTADARQCPCFFNLHCGVQSIISARKWFCKSIQRFNLSILTHFSKEGINPFMTEAVII